MTNEVTKNSQAIVVYNPNQAVSFRSPINVKSFFNQNPNKVIKQIGEGRVFVLLGTSTAGKTSIIQSLKKGDANWSETGGDLASFEYFGNIIKELYPEKYTILARSLDLAELAHAVMERSYTKRLGIAEDLDTFAKTFTWKTDSPILIKEALEAIEFLSERKEELDDVMKMEETGHKILAYLFDTIIQRSKQGQHVIFDIMAEDIPRLFVERNFAAPTKLGLAFCPFSTLAGRVLTRNKNALERNDHGDIRNPIVPLRQYAETYRAAKPGETVLETLSRDQVVDVFNKGYSQELDFIREYHPEAYYKVASSYDGILSEILENLGFSDPNVKQVNITPRFQNFDYLFNTSEILPHESSEIIRQWK